MYRALQRCNTCVREGGLHAKGGSQQHDAIPRVIFPSRSESTRWSVRSNMKSSVMVKGEIVKEMSVK